MSIIFRKISVLAPVVVLGAFYLYDHAAHYRQASTARLGFLALSFLLVYGWFLAETIARRQAGRMSIVIQSSFFVYIFMVLTLTGYFFLFRELNSPGRGYWWENILRRIEARDHVNLELFKIFRIYKISSTQIVGNFLMLFPLAIYIQLLYKKLGHFMVTLLLCALASLLIECLQLVTRFRSADVDDILLNTAGAFTGLVLFRIGRRLAGWGKPPGPGR